MYKRLSRFAQNRINRHAPPGPGVSSKRESSIYIDTPENRSDPRYRLIDTLNRSAARATPSLRKTLEPGIRNSRSAARATPSLRKTLEPGIPLPPSRIPPIPDKRLYLVLFTERWEPKEQFLIVGISGLKLATKFQQDRRNYDFSLIARSQTEGASAKILESVFHKTFSAERFSPKRKLKSGNIECYRYDDNILEKMKYLVEGN